MSKVVFDIESNGLLDTADKIHCIVIRELGVDHSEVYHDDPELPRDGTVEQALKRLRMAEVAFAHNGVGFDIPLLKKLYKLDLNKHVRCYDTFILSQLFFPNEMMSHSIDAWGKVFKTPKVEHEDWTTLTAEMIHRCVIDVDILYKLVTRICTELGEFPWQDAIQLEHDVYEIFCQHQTHAVLDVKWLQLLRKRFEQAIHICDNLLLANIPKRVVAGKEVNPFKKDGTLTVRANKLAFEADILPTAIQGPFSIVSIEDVNLNSTQQIINHLLSIGWKPDTFTDKGSPSLRESSFKGVPKGIKRLLEKRNMFKHRFGLVKGFDERRDGNTLEMFAYTCGTNTARFQHRGVANLPRVQSPYGKHIRRIFTAPEGQVMVGCDASQLEARIEGHFCVPTTNTILTRRGWKTYDQLVIGEEVLAYDIESDTKVWTPLLDVNVFEDAPLINMSAGNLSFTSTPNHRWYVDKRYTHTGEYKREVITTEKLDTTHSIIRNAPLRPDQDLVPSTHTMHYHKNGGNWPQRVLNMSQQERLSFLEGFMLADGHLDECKPHHKKKRANRWKWSQNEGEMFEAALLASYLVHDKGLAISERTYKSGKHYCVSLGPNRRVTGTSLKKQVLSAGQVWCPTTKYGTWVMREGNHITITGNTSYFDGGTYAKMLLEADMHQVNADAWKMSRQDAKGPGYALAYQCSPKKVQELLECSEERAKGIHKTYWDMRPAAKRLISDLETAVKKRLAITSKTRKKPDLVKNRAWVKGIDGRKLFVRSWHSLKNTLIQNAGMIAMKVAYIQLAERLAKECPTAKIWMFYHDEYQIWCDPADAAKVQSLAEQSIIDAGKHLQLNIELAAESAVGHNWRETH